MLSSGILFWRQSTTCSETCTTLGFGSSNHLPALCELSPRDRDHSSCPGGAPQSFFKLKSAKNYSQKSNQPEFLKGVVAGHVCWNSCLRLHPLIQIIRGAQASPPEYLGIMLLFLLLFMSCPCSFPLVPPKLTSSSSLKPTPNRMFERAEPEPRQCL